MLAEQLRRGAIVGGRRVVGLRPGVRDRGTRVVTAVFDDGGEQTYTIGRRVPGSAPRTDIPAGPVGAGRGTRSTGAGWRDGDDPSSWHTRLIDRVVYA